MNYILISLLLLFNQPQNEKKTIIFFGDSITAAYGLELIHGYPALIYKKIKEAGLNYNVINAGLTGETTAGGLRRINWILKQDVDVFVLALGGNDGLRGLSVADTESNLQGIIDRVRNKNPDVKILITGMQAPPNMGNDFAYNFKKIYPKLQKKNNITLMPFLLEDVGGKDELNLPDGIHPNKKGYELIAKNLWKQLKGLLYSKKEKNLYEF